MLCQNCKKNEATMHLKRIVNGSASQLNLCADCARSLGYGDAFSGMGVGFGELLGDIFGRGEITGSAAKCAVCGKTFDDIIQSGYVGCPECYSVFYDKLLPSIKRIHGNARHIGKVPADTAAGFSADDLSALLNGLFNMEGEE